MAYDTIYYEFHLLLKDMKEGEVVLFHHDWQEFGIPTNVIEENFMKIIFENFKSFKDEKHQEFQICLILMNSFWSSQITVRMSISKKESIF